MLISVEPVYSADTERPVSVTGLQPVEGDQLPLNALPALFGPTPVGAVTVAPVFLS